MDKFVSREVSFFTLEKHIKILLGISLLVLCGGAFFLYVNSTSFLSSEVYKENELEIPLFTKEKGTASISEIDESSFLLSSQDAYASIPDLSKQILFIGKNMRPDKEKEDARFFLYSLGSGEKAICMPEKRIYLCFSKEGIDFSNEKTPLFIKPFLLPDGSVRLDAYLRILNEKNEVVLNEKKQFFLEEKTPAAREERVDHIAFRKLLKALAWEPDKLWEFSSDASKRGKCRLEFKEDLSPMLFVGEGEMIVFDQKTWREIHAGENTQELPLAKVKSVSPHRIDLDFWDEKGFSKMNVSLTFHKLPPSHTRPEELFTRVRKRTENSVSLKLAGKSMFLKQGDWILKVDSTWKLIRNKEDLKTHYLGEVFVFQGIEKEEGKLWFKGSLFDPMRSSVLEVKLPFIASKAPASSQKRLFSREKLKKALKR